MGQLVPSMQPVLRPPLKAGVAGARDATPSARPLAQRKTDVSDDQSQQPPPPPAPPPTEAEIAAQIEAANKTANDAVVRYVRALKKVQTNAAGEIVVDGFGLLVNVRLLEAKLTAVLCVLSNTGFPIGDVSSEYTRILTESASQLEEHGSARIRLAIADAIGGSRRQ